MSTLQIVNMADGKTYAAKKLTINGTQVYPPPSDGSGLLMGDNSSTSDIGEGQLLINSFQFPAPSTTTGTPVPTTTTGTTPDQTTTTGTTPGVTTTTGTTSGATTTAGPIVYSLSGQYLLYGENIVGDKDVLYGSIMIVPTVMLPDASPPTQWDGSGIYTYLQTYANGEPDPAHTQHPAISFLLAWDIALGLWEIVETTSGTTLIGPNTPDSPVGEYTAVHDYTPEDGPLHLYADSTETPPLLEWPNNRCYITLDVEAVSI